MQAHLEPWQMPRTISIAEAPPTQPRPPATAADGKRRWWPRQN